MRLLAIDDLDLTSLALPELPLITANSKRMDYGTRRRDGIGGSVYFGGQPDIATWNILIKTDAAADRNAILAALASDVTTERRLLAQRDDDDLTQVLILAAPTKIAEANEFDFSVDLESSDSVWVAAAEDETVKTFQSANDNALALTVPGNTRTVPTVTLRPNVRRLNPAANVGFRYRRRYVVANNSAVPWLRLPVRISLGDTTTAVVGAGKALASGNDVRVIVDGVEIQRTLVTWNSAASFVWLILDAVPAGTSKTVEVWYGDAAAGSPPALAYPNLPPFVLASSTNASLVYNTDDVAANKGLGVYYLFGTVPGASADFTVPGAWKRAATLENLDNQDDRAQLTSRTYVDTGTWINAGLEAYRSSPGNTLFPVVRNPYDGVRFYHPLGISSITVGFQMLNENGVGALVVLARDSDADEWVKLLNHTTAHATLTAIGSATYTPAASTKHVATALWPANGNFIPDNTVGQAHAVFDGNLTVAIDNTNLAITGGTEEEIYELATTLRIGGGANGAAPYRALEIGNANATAGAGTPRAAVLLDQQALVLDCHAHTHEIWTLVASTTPWTPAALGNQLRAWYKADAITGVADGGAVASWPDSSGNGNTATQGTGANQPLYRANRANGLPGVEFNGTTQFLACALTSSSLDESIYAVIDLDTVGPRAILGPSANGGREFRVNASRQLEYNKPGTAILDATAATVTIDADTIVGGTLLATTGEETVNGTTETFTHAQTLTAALTSQIGASVGAEFYDGDLHEIIVLAGASTIKRQLIEGYLAWKWGLTASLPGGHPYKTTPPMLLAPGTFVERMSTHAVTPLAGWVDNNGATVETPANDWLPLLSSSAAVSSVSFTGGITGWTASIAATISYTAQVGAAGSGNGQFANVRQIAVDSTGRIWAADTDNERLQRFTAVPAYSIQTGTLGAGDGQFASNNGAYGVAIDASDNVLATDRGNQRYQTFNGGTGAFASKVSGSTFAYVAHSVYGPTFNGLAINGINGLAVDPSGNAYIPDVTNSRVVKVSNAGAYLASITGLTNPVGVAVDSSGNVYVSYNSTKLSKYNSSLVLQWTQTIGPDRLGDIATDNTNLYLVDSAQVAYKRLCSTGAAVTTFGGLGTGDGQLTNAAGIGTDGTNVYISDAALNRVQKFTTAGVFVTKWGTTGSGTGQFNIATGVAIDASGNIWVGDRSNNRLQRFSNVGVYQTSAAVTGPGPGAAIGPGDTIWVSTPGSTVTRLDQPLAQPEGIAVNKSTGRVYVTDTFNHCVEAFTSAGAFEFVIGQSGTATGQFNTPVAVSVNQGTGDIYVADQGNQRVQQFDQAGTFIRAWGSNGAGNGQFLVPTAIAVNPATAEVWVIDSGRDDAQRFTATGTFVSKTGSSGSGNGQFLGGSGIAIDPTGAIIYISDKDVSRIQRFDSVSVGAMSWDGAVGGAAAGSLKLALTVALGGTSIGLRAVEDAWRPLNSREAVQVSSWVTTDSASMVPLLQVEFSNADGVILSTVTESVWTPVAGQKPRRIFAAAAVEGATQYRLGLALYAASGAATGQVWFDDIQINASELVFIDQALGEIEVTVAIRGRWIG
jgi:sugar lactone lactonase YvrE